jgi:tetratricopeptide (TPR) repeat protein
LGNEGFSEVIVRKEIESPNITIFSPLDLDLFGKTPPTYNVKISDNNGVHTMWYTLNNDMEIPFTENGTISQSAWNLCDHGTVSIKFYANNTLGNTDFEEIIVQKDIHAPMITINLPFNNTLYGINAPSFNVIITDPNGIDVKWYTIDEGNINITFTSNGIINQGLWNACGNGKIIIGFYANDSLGNEGYNEVIVRKDTISPSILINSPYPYQLFGVFAPSFNVRINDSSGINTMWYSINDGVDVMFSTNGTINQGLWSLCGNGTVSIKFYARDSLSNEGYEEIIVRKDIDPPSIIINSPYDYQICNETAPSFNVTITDINGVNTTWYSLDGGITNMTFTINGLIDQTIWDSFGDGIINIIFYANNSVGTVGSSVVVVIKDICAPRITINTPYNNSYWNKEPTFNFYASDMNFDKLWCKIQNSNISLINGEEFKLNTSIWDSLDEGFFQIFIYANDTVGHLNDTLVLNLCKDTINPNEPQMSIYPTGEVSIPIIFDWEEVNDTSGIKYYRLIIDNEDNPFAIPGFIFEINISNTYYELVDYLIPRNYYFFIYPIDNAGNQGNPASDIFTIKGTVVPPAEFPWWIILIVILISVVGSVTAIVTLRKKSQKKMSLPRKKIPIKVILSHLDKIVVPDPTLDKKGVQNILIQKEESQSYEKELLDKQELDINIDKIKSFGEELFKEGAYLEAIKQFQYAKDILSNHGRNEDAILFSDLVAGVEGLIEEREKRLEILEKGKIEGDSVKVFELYYDIMEISKKLRDLDAVSMFQSELIQYFQMNKFKLRDIESYKLNLEKEADSLSNNGYYEKAAQIYAKCEEISQLLVKLEKEEELANLEK